MNEVEKSVYIIDICEQTRDDFYAEIFKDHDFKIIQSEHIYQIDGKKYDSYRQKIVGVNLDLGIVIDRLVLWL